MMHEENAVNQADTQDLLLEIKQINKYFPGVHALKNVDLKIGRGEVHAVCGENGAGKSTLMKILTGAYSADSGSVIFDGQKLDGHTVEEVIDLGISCIYQELTMVPLIDVAKNLFLGRLPVNKAGVINYKKLYADAGELLKKLKLNVSPRKQVSKLSLAQQQMLEIGRAISRNAKLIIMDEPTSSLSAEEINTLFALIKELKESGVSILFISHKLEEVFEIADHISVFRDGESVAHFDAKQVNANTLVEHMIGRKLENYYNKENHRTDEVLLEVNGLTRKRVFSDISFTLNKGEILGVYGLVGAGRTEIANAIFGIDRFDAGTITLSGEKIKIHGPESAIQHGICLVPEDRKLEGLVLGLSVMDNSTLVKLPEIATLGVIQRRAEYTLADEYRQALNIKTPTLSKKVGELSGGNQQKVCLAKWIMKNPRILILDEPTRGIDVGAKCEIYRIINQLTERGMGVILISSDLNEILGTSDRILTICNGKVSGILDASKTYGDEVFRHALGKGGTNGQE